MKMYCPNCEKETIQQLVQSTEIFNIRGQSIPVKIEYHHCDECGEDVEHPRPGYDPLGEAYREYRNRVGLLQPEQIKIFRKKLGLTQKEFSEILSIGIATINRYENGALQSESHDQIIRYAMDPKQLKELVIRNKDKLSEQKVINILEQLESHESGCSDLINETVEKFGNYPADIMSGFMSFNLEKLGEVIKFFCHKGGVVKTKLLKMLFYADFYHYKQYSTSITGLRYAHAPFGPVPDKFDTWLTILKDWKKEINSEVQKFHNYVGEVFISESPDLKYLDSSEIEILNKISGKLSTFNAAMISEYAHEEIAYKATQDGELISYQYADDLVNIDNQDI